MITEQPARIGERESERATGALPFVRERFVPLTDGRDHQRGPSIAQMAKWACAPSASAFLATHFRSKPPITGGERRAASGE